MDGADWADDEPFEPRPPLPPEDRVWRHPSELASSPFPGTPMASAFVADPPSRWGRMTGLFVVATAGAVLVAFAFHLTFKPGPAAVPSTTIGNVPAAAVTATVSTLISSPGGGRAWLGISGADVDGVATVGEVKDGSPAEEAGVLPADQVVAVDGVPVDGMADLVEAIDLYSPGDSCTLTVLRASQPVDVVVVLGGRT